MVKFILAKELKKKFIAMGMFYRMHLENVEPILCRNVLEIFNKEYYKENNLISASQHLKANALFIMMNPGKSEPINGLKWKDFHFRNYDLTTLYNTMLVRAKPDKTQYQVMRLMVQNKWNHVRVINLSDIKDEDSDSFIKRKHDIEINNGFYLHSIFEDRRNDELKVAFNLEENAIIILAWGVNENLIELGEKAFSKLPIIYPALGLETGKSPFLFYHPLPRGKGMVKKWKGWLNNIQDRIDELN